MKEKFQVLSTNTAAKAILYVFLFVFIPLKIAGHAFDTFDPIYPQLLPDFPGPVWINVKTFGVLQASGKLIGSSFFLSLMLLAIILTAMFLVFYNMEGKFFNKARTIIGSSLLIKFALFVIMIVLINYVANPIFFFAYDGLLYLSEAELAGEKFFYRAPETWMRSITPAISTASALYPMAIVVFPWERKQRIEAEVRTAIREKERLGFDDEAIRKWIVPAANKVIKEKGWQQKEVLNKMNEAGCYPRSDHANVSNWCRGTQPMPRDVISFFILHGALKHAYLKDIEDSDAAKTPPI